MTCNDCKHFNYCTRKNDYLYYHKAVCDFFTDKQSRVIPCKIGDEVWAFRNCVGTKIIRKAHVSEMYFVGEEMKLCIVAKGVGRGEWMKTVFPSYEEAQKRLDK